MASSAPNEVPLFTDDSMIRRVHREGVLLLGGGRALLMQVAHPSVANGVAEHSSYRARRLGRLLRTLRLTLTIAFGSPAQAEAAAAAINAVHERVRGEGYRATDPDLLTWVLATLIDTALVVYGRFVGPLPPEAAEAYYRDMQALGRVLGIPEGFMPPAVAQFEAYVAGMIDGLHVSDNGRAIADELLRPASWMWPVREISAGLLPPGLRRQFGLSWGPRREWALDWSARASRAIIPHVPAGLRAPPSFLMPPRGE